jgi:hypothetical protein
MMSISPPLGHGPFSLRVQKAGQVAQPAGMCARSSTIKASSYAVFEEMRMLSRPRALGSTMLTSSARIKNLFPTTEGRKSVSQDSDSDGRRSAGRRTVCQIFANGIGFAHIVNAAMGGVIFGLPVPALIEVFANPLVLETELRTCTRALYERE